jgi:hypothetical protein
VPTLVTFADSTLHHSSKRLYRQARRMDTFSSIEIMNESSLDQSFLSKHRESLSRDVRGFGYWIWKPQVILQCLNIIPMNDFLVYLDVGCHLNPAGKKRLLEYFSIVAQSKTGILAFNSVKGGQTVHKEEQWSKGDTLLFFDVMSKAMFRESAQIEATVIVIQKRFDTHLFFEKWLNIMQTNPSLVDDSISSTPNAIDFVENRHDQSIFSLLGKLEEITLLPHEENFPLRRTRFSRKPAWSDLKQMPIHARRDKDRFSTHLKRDIRNGILFVFALRFRKRLTKNN